MVHTMHHIFVAMPATVRDELELTTGIAELAALGRVTVWDETAAQLADALATATVVVTGWGTPALTTLTHWTPHHATQLVVHTAGTVKHLIPVTALIAGLRVSHANVALADSVAEFTIGTLIMARRNVFAAAQRYRTQQPPLPIHAQHELRGSTVGIIGASAIGRRVMQLLPVFGVRILLCDPYVTSAVAAQYQATLVPLDTLLQHSDIVSLHAPVTPHTIGMLGAREFALMRDGTWFINTARGRLIDADALLGELQRGRLNALLDVTDPHEPLAADSPFWALDNCVILPHMAAVTRQARLRQRDISIAEIRRFIHGEALLHQVTAAQWDTMA